MSLAAVCLSGRWGRTCSEVPQLQHPDFGGRRSTTAALHHEALLPAPLLTVAGVPQLVSSHHGGKWELLRNGTRRLSVSFFCLQSIDAFTR